MTVADAVTRVRRLIRDLRGGTYNSDNILMAINDAVQLIHQHLSNIQSNLVYAKEDITTTVGTREYSLSGVDHVMPDPEAVYVSGSDTPLERIYEHDLARIGDDGTNEGEPKYFYLTEVDGSGGSLIGFSPIPDDAYTVTVFYKPDPVSFSDADSTPLPYGGVWDQVIVLMAAMDLREIMEGDLTYLLAKYNAAYSQAMQETFRRGVRPRRFTNTFFVPAGV